MTENKWVTGVITTVSGVVILLIIGRGPLCTFGSFHRKLVGICQSHGSCRVFELIKFIPFSTSVTMEKTFQLHGKNMVNFRTRPTLLFWVNRQ